MDEPAVAAFVRYAGVCASRLGEDPRDPDALFALAAVLAVAERWRETLEVLDLLSKGTPRYPGLWEFKARAYRELGDAPMEALCHEAAAREARALAPPR